MADEMLYATTTGELMPRAGRPETARRVKVRPDPLVVSSMRSWVTRPAPLERASLQTWIEAFIFPRLLQKFAPFFFVGLEAVGIHGQP